MNAAANHRRIARTDQSVRIANGGKLPRFRAFIQRKGQYDDTTVGEIVPYDGTPETALDILRRQVAGAEMSQVVFVGVNIVPESVTYDFFAQVLQAISQWRESYQEES